MDKDQRNQHQGRRDAGTGNCAEHHFGTDGGAATRETPPSQTDEGKNKEETPDGCQNAKAPPMMSWSR